MSRSTGTWLRVCVSALLHLHSNHNPPSLSLAPCSLPGIRPRTFRLWGTCRCRAQRAFLSCTRPCRQSRRRACMCPSCAITHQTIRILNELANNTCPVSQRCVHTFLSSLYPPWYFAPLIKVIAPSPCFFPLSHWPSYVSPFEYRYMPTPLRVPARNSPSYTSAAMQGQSDRHAQPHSLRSARLPQMKYVPFPKVYDVCF